MSRHGPEPAWDWELPWLPHGNRPDPAGARELRTWKGRAPRPPASVAVARTADSLLATFHCGGLPRHGNPSLPRDRPVWRLWERDVVELFVSATAEGRPYREIEVSPAGQWLTLAFDDYRRPRPEPWRPPLGRSVRVGADGYRVDIELPLAALAFPAAPSACWRLGLFHVRGAGPGRSHLGLRSAGTARPDFHDPRSWLRIAPLT